MANQESRKQEAEVAAKKVLADFQASFAVNEVQVDAGDGKKHTFKAFVRGEKLVPSSQKGEFEVQEASAEESRIYTPSLNKSSTSKPTMKAFFRQDDDEEEQPKPEPKKTVSRRSAKKRSAMDELKEELAKRQQRRDEKGLTVKETLTEMEREERLARHTRPANAGTSAAQGGPGSYDDGDPDTTNLFIGHLNPAVREDALFRLFRRYGPIASVKIMWPRTPDEFARGFNSAFIAFGSREDASRALDDLLSITLFEFEIRINWGKKMQVVPAMQVNLPQLEAMANHAIQAARGAALAQGRDVSPEPIFIVHPHQREMQDRIDTAAHFVIEHGRKFEQALSLREKANPDFAFLRDPTSYNGQYYRWRVYSLKRGDSLRRWRTDKFQMYEDGPFWYPPPRLSSATRRPERAKKLSGSSAKDKDTTLSSRSRESLEKQLRSLTAERERIGDLMVFALDHADKAQDVAQTIAESLIIETTPVHTKLARLYLVSDILYNTSNVDIPNASKYRSAFEKELPAIMQSFNTVLNNIASRMAAQNLRERVCKVLRIWESWSVFSEMFISGLQSTFLLEKASEETTTATTATTASSSTVTTTGVLMAENIDDIDGVPMEEDQVLPEATPEELALDNLDDRSLTLRCQASGIPATGGRADMLRRLKKFLRSRGAGLASYVAPSEVQEDEDLDGMPLDPSLFE